MGRMTAAGHLTVPVIHLTASLVFQCVEFVAEDSYIVVDLKLNLCTVYEPGQFS